MKYDRNDPADLTRMELIISSSNLTLCSPSPFSGKAGKDITTPRATDCEKGIVQTNEQFQREMGDLRSTYGSVEDLRQAETPTGLCSNNGPNCSSISRRSCSCSSSWCFWELMFVSFRRGRGYQVSCLELARTRPWTNYIMPRSQIALPAE
jgi:hypothetical protein